MQDEMVLLYIKIIAQSCLELGYVLEMGREVLKPPSVQIQEKKLSRIRTPVSLASSF